jgi:protein-S-isoprenylcysteine O-methyltransferase Ste14
VLGGNWSAVVSFKEGHELIDRGPYHYARHPIYTGILLMLLGTAIVDGHAIWIVVLSAAFIGLSIKARSEERLLTRHFPDAYPAYRRRVKAILPFVY